MGSTLVYRYRKYISIIIILSLLSHCAISLGMHSFFYFFQDYVIKEYCINNDKPELECKGTCFLKKELATNEDDSEKIIYVNTIVITECPVTLIELNNTWQLVSISWMFPYSDAVGDILGKGLFHPPQA